MNPSLYKAAVEGNSDIIFQPNTYKLDSQITPNHNTVLHVAALNGNTNFVQIAASACPSLLFKVNIRNETALHIAAREGHRDLSRVLIERAGSFQRDLEPGHKKIAVMVDSDGDTALHKAVRNGSCGVAKVLIESDPDFEYPPNKAMETPLYLAAEHGCKLCLSKILSSCSVPSYGGPKGRTALHGAVVSNHEECVKMLLERKRSLCEEADEYEWIPLHYTALFGLRKQMKQMLSISRSLAYVATDKDKATALHIAAGQGQVGIMEELILQCPDCWESLNNKGQNILHVAIANRRKKVIEFILDSASLSPLIGERDMDGNTPLHLLATSRCFMPRLLSHPRANKMAFNNEHLNPLDLVYSKKYSSNWGLIRRSLRKSGRFGLRNVVRDENDIAREEEALEKDEKIIQVLRKEAEIRLIVAALIATVTFAAGFTVPGGYVDSGSDKGMAVLARKAAFVIFLITDTLALVCSTSAAFVYFLKADFRNRHKIIRHYALAKALITISMGAVVITFFTGLVAVLKNSPGLVIALGIICCSCFSVYYYELRPAFKSSRIYSEQSRKRGRPVYMIWGTKTPSQ